MKPPEQDEGKNAAAWRAMRDADLPDILAIAARLHPGFPERPEVFQEKLRLFPAGCLTLARDAAVCGYAFSHPWRLDDIPRLDTLLGALPTSPDCLHLHDIAILPSARGRSAATALEGLLVDVAQRCDVGWITLVSLYGSHKLWSRLGYRPRPCLSETLRDYGDSALYMTKSLALS